MTARLDEISGSAYSSETADRKPWAAAALSFAVAGLGHLYAGRPFRAALTFLLVAVGSVSGVAAAMSLRGMMQLAAYGALIAAMYGAPALDAFRIAARTPGGYRLHWYNRWYVYLAIFLVSALGWQPWLRHWLRASVVEAFTIPADSMAPTISSGDYIMTRRWRGPVTRGDIVVYRRGGNSLVSRVVGLPGDTIAMREGSLVIGGREVAEPYARRDTADPVYPELSWQAAHLTATADRASYHPTMFTWGPLVVPAGQYFLLGDNRSDSFDTRLAGFTPRDSIVKQPTVVYFSRDVGRGRIRWERIGREFRR